MPPRPSPSPPRGGATSGPAKPVPRWPAIDVSPGASAGGRLGPGGFDRRAMEWPAAVVAAVAVSGRAGLAGAAATFMAAGGVAGLDLRHRVAGRHVLVAVHLDAHLWGTGRAAGCHSGAVAGGRAGFVLRRRLRGLCRAGSTEPPVARPALRGAVAIGGTDARHLVHRLSLGRRRLCARGRTAVVPGPATGRSRYRSRGGAAGLRAVTTAPRRHAEVVALLGRARRPGWTAGGLQHRGRAAATSGRPAAPVGSAAAGQYPAGREVPGRHRHPGRAGLVRPPIE